MTHEKEGAQSPDQAAPQAISAAESTASAIATEVNREHALATQHAERAIEHARRIGLLLIEAKRALGHGKFQSWLTANVSFSPRQAQRYMSAAHGRPLPVRKIAALPKCDTVSHLTIADIPMPRFKAGEFLRAVAVVHDCWYDEFLLMPAAADRAFVAHINGPADGNQLAAHGTVWTWRRPAVDVADLPRLPLVFSFPWERAEIVERFPREPFALNVFEEVLGGNPGTTWTEVPL